MKKLILIFSLHCAFFASNLTAQWFLQNPQPTDYILYSVKFIDSLRGWTVGERGVILKTSDGGNNWMTQSSGTVNTLTSVYFISETTGWAVGYGGTILRTTNGGSSWIVQQSGTSLYLKSVFFTSPTIGWVVGNETVLKTTNSGETWVKQQGPIHFATLSMTSIYFTSYNDGLILGEDWSGLPMTSAWILKTTNGGIDWWPFKVDATKRLKAAHFPTSTIGWVVGGSIFKTTDSGYNWMQQNIGVNATMYSVYFSSTTNGLAVGFGWNGSDWGGLILNTTDGGVTWEMQTYITQNTLMSIYFVTPKIGWVVGDRGTILKTTNGGVTFVENENNFTQPKDFNLYQNYPNPFNPITKISWQSPVSSWQTLKVYDILGNEVATLVNEEKPAGSYEVEFNGRNLSSGVYFYQLRAGSLMETKKMMLLR